LYRYPNEHPILFLTIFLIGLVLAVSAIPTLCIFPFLAGGFIVLAYLLNGSRKDDILRHGLRVNAGQAPQLAGLAAECLRRLKPGPVEIYLVRSNSLNAYTFGFSNPKIVVLYSPLLQVMDAEELKFVIGHELGHVALGHTWLNTLLGGMAGVPTGFAGAVILTLAFRSWNRACEFSADRAGLLACGSLGKSISALAQLAVGDINTQAELQQALALLEKEDDSFSGAIGEALSTHPMIIKRIHELRVWAGSEEYKRVAVSN
jgi:Zn-dependent protease with chaperone function